MAVARRSCSNLARSPRLSGLRPVSIASTRFSRCSHDEAMTPAMCRPTNAMRDVWRWSVPLAAAASGFFLLFDVAFFSANLLKIREGGWVPLLLGALVFIIMTTWHRGIEALGRSVTQKPEALEDFIGQLESGRIVRVPGTAVFRSEER